MARKNRARNRYDQAGDSRIDDEKVGTGIGAEIGIETGIGTGIGIGAEIGTGANLKEIGRAEDNRTGTGDEGGTGDEDGTGKSAAETARTESDQVVLIQKKKRGRPREKRDTMADDRASVQAILDTLSGLAIALTKSPEAGLSVVERSLVEPAAERMLARASEAARARVTEFSDPVILVTGLALWSARVASLSRKKPQDRVTDRQPQPAAEQDKHESDLDLQIQVGQEFFKRVGNTL